MSDIPRLIEFAFPLKQASLDSVHEKNVRHGHISTLHIWPARRPLAACRAALIATLLPDPGSPHLRQELCEKIAGKLVRKSEKRKMPGGQVVEREKEETEGGILHWGREVENAETLEWFRQEIRKAHGGRAPKVLDPFAGGGAIPLEAMRLGCEATAIDINPVAWFILKCSLEYPQKLAGQKRPLPRFVLKKRDFMEAFFKAHGLTRTEIRRELEKLGMSEDAKPPLKGLEYEAQGIDADLAWHIRAWGQWVLDRARKDLARYYPVYADFEPVHKDKKSYEQQPMRHVPATADGVADIDGLNAEFSADYLAVKSNPRWVAKPTVAYLWARTVTCKNCRGSVPLLKTRWLCRNERRRILLTMEPNRQNNGVVFGIESDVPVKGGNAAQRREHDKRLGAGTMSRAGAKCPCCGTIMRGEDIRFEGQKRRLGRLMTCVVIDTPSGKRFRLPTEFDLECDGAAAESVSDVFADVPFNIPHEPIPRGASRVGGAHKEPDAWETLVGAIIQAGFIVDGSWPIQTEMGNRTRAHGSAALASSVWLICKKRSPSARPGWDNKVLDDMRVNISQRLREFWDAGVRGPDFVWAATGPALEAYSKHPIVKMADDPGSTMTVKEFLTHARRMVVDFVVGRVLGGNGDDPAESAADRLDEITAYYLLHRNDFGLDDAPVGACILYATACGLSDHELLRDWDLLAKTRVNESANANEEEEELESNDDPADEIGSGSKLKLKAWNQRRATSLGVEAPGGRAVPVVDRIHRLIHLWKGGDVHKVDEYLDEHGLRRHELFRRVLQSLIELAKAGTEERSLLESLSNHIGAKGARKKDPQRALAYVDDE